jgi:REP-associated tyrosine transposase
MPRNANDPVGRRSLPHDPPLSIDTAKEIFFITICCQPRGENQLCHELIAKKLFKAARFYEQQHHWHVFLILLMPDHFHMLVSFAASTKIRDLIARWKRYTSTHAGIIWQRDFFDHRLRRDESFREKSDYILRNPVRAGLIEHEDDWPYRLIEEQQ